MYTVLRAEVLLGQEDRITVFIHTYHSQLLAPPTLQYKGAGLSFHPLAPSLSSAKR